MRSRLPGFCTVLSFAAFFLSAQFLAASNTWSSAASLNQARSGSAAVRLSDGRILFTGGAGASGPLTSTEFFNTGGSISAGASMQQPRTGHAAVLLQDGRMLVTGGTTTSNTVTNSAEIYDPASNMWTSVPNGMNTARSGETATLLNDGRVLIAGGQGTGGPTNTLEIYSPSTNSFTLVSGSLSSPRQQPAATLLQDGRVLIAGGSDGSKSLSSVDIYDPSSGVVSPVSGSMSAARAGLSATTLLDGTVLLAGGNDGSNDLNSADIYNPATPGFSPTGALGAARSGHLAFLLPNNNQVLIVGGTAAGTSLQSVELFTPWTGKFTFAAAMSTARSSAAGSALQQDGQLLVGGGANGTTPLSSAEIYNFATVKTDNSDYPPGTTVNISGSGWQPGETVTLTLVESPLYDTHGPYTAVADSNGNISNSQFVTDSHDANIRFYLTAKGSVSQAQNTFTDTLHLQSVAVGAQTPNQVTPGSSAIYPVTVTFNGSGSCTVNLNVTTVLPTGAHASFSSSPVTGTTTQATSTSTLTITTSSSTPVGPTSFTVQAKGTGGTGNDCTLNDIATVSASLVVGGAAATNLSVASATGNYGGTTTLSATLTSSSSPVSGKPVAFALNGASAGTATTDANGVATLSNVSLGSIAAGTYATGVGASFGGDSSLQGISGTAMLTVNKATPMITWTNPAAVIYGTALSGTQLNATANVPGSFAYTPAAGAVLGAGPQSLNATFTPTDTTDYATATASVTLTVNKATPTVTWSNPADIGYGTALSGTQLNAAANVAGSFGYTPGAGTVLNAGNGQTLSVTFTPTDTADYNNASGSATINVLKATPVVTATGGTFTYNGGAEPGSCGVTPNTLPVTAGYSPGSGAPVIPGTYTLTCSAAATTNYNAGSGTATITIQQATPVVTDNGPGASTWGQPVTLSVTVAPPNGGVPTGTVTFSFTQNSTTWYVCADGSISTTSCTVNVSFVNGAYAASVTTNHLPTAADSVTATYSGDQDFIGEAAMPVTVTVSQADTATSLTSSNATTATYGDSLALTVKVKDNTASSTGVPTGTVTLSFKLDPNDANAPIYNVCKDGSIGTATCASDNQIALAADSSDTTGTTATATVTTTHLPAGLSAKSFAYSLNASYSGDTNFKTSSLPAGLSQTVNQRPITVTAAGDTKTYDGGTASSGIPTITTGTLVNGDSGKFTQTFDNRNAGTGKALTPVGAVNDGFGGSNYAITFAPASTGVINALGITVTAVSDQKTYDGTTSSKGTPAIAPALISGDTSGFTQAFATKNVGTGKTLTPSGSASDGNGGKNYAVTFATNASGKIDAAPLTITAQPNTKQYDGSTSAAATPTITGLQTGDTATAAETYDNKNVATGKTLSVSTYTVNDGNAGKNYTTTPQTSTAGVITQAPLTITAVTNTKIYDGTTTAAGTPQVSGVQTGDTVTKLAETYDTATAGTGKMLSVMSYIVNDGNNGANYTVKTVADNTGAIQQATPAVTDAPTTIEGSGNSIYGQPVTLSVTVAAPFGGAPTGTVTFSFVQNSATYYVCADGSVSTTACPVPVTASNGTYLATVVTNHLPPGTAGVTGTYSGDTDFLGEAAQPVTVTVSQADTATSLSITDVTTASSTGTATYGDELALTVKVKDNAQSSTGVPGGTVALSFQLDPTAQDPTTYYLCADGTIGTAPCASQKQITLKADTGDSQGITATATVNTTHLPAGLSALQFAYSLNASYSGDTNFKSSGLATGLSETVNQRPITVTAASDTKLYDGGTASTGTPTITSGSLVNGDTGSFTQTFDNRNAGTGKALTPKGSIADGFGGANYAITFTPVSTGTVNRLAITVTAVQDKKTYDGTTSSKGVPTISPALISGDTSGFTQTFGTKNVGTGLTLTLAGSVNDNNGGKNYAVTFASNTSGEIDAAPLTITAQPNTKQYDGSTSAAATPTITGLQTGDTATAAETYDNKNVATGKTLSVSTYTVNDGNAGKNYTTSTQSSTAGVITPATLTVTAPTLTISWGLSLPALAPAITGYINGETATAVSTLPVCTVTVLNNPPPVGSYTTSCDHGSATNYNFTYISGLLTVVDTTPPVVTTMALSSYNVPVTTGTTTLTATISDVNTGNSNIKSAEYSLDGGGTWSAFNAGPAASTWTASANLGPFPSTAVLNVCVRGTDVANNTSANTASCALLAAYDPSGGFVTGGGWITSPVGASVLYPNATGKANFGFNSQYKKGATTPTGDTQFQFQAGNLNFHANIYQWMVVSGSNVQYKGSNGTINGSGNYDFMLTACDASVSGKCNAGTVDTFRIKIMDASNGDAVVYDNMMGQADTGSTGSPSTPTTAIGGGDIVIHKGN